MIERGSIVEIKEKDRIVCGVVLSSTEKLAHVLTADSRDFKTSFEKILSSHSTLDVGKGKDFLTSSLREINARRETLRNQIQLSLLWEIVGSAGQEARAPEELAFIYFGKECGPDEVAAMTRSLHQDWGYFRPRGSGFFAVDAKTVKVMEEGRKRQEEHRLREGGFVSWLSKGGEEPLPQGSSSFLEILKDFFIFGEQSAKSRQAQDLMKKGKMADLDLLFKILVQNGVFAEDENLLLSRYRVPGEFSSEQNEEAARALKSHVLSLGRLDLTHLDTITIDDEATTDIDDALSLETLRPDGWRVGIHIADVSEWVLKDSLLDKEAHARSSSIYLPDQKINMLPDLMADSASLIKGEKRPALSILASFHKNGQMTSWEMKETWIQVKERLTYDQVDERLELDPMLSKLYDLAFQFQEERKKAGALVIQFPRIEVCLDKNSGEIFVKRAKLHTRSQVLVSECMILANRLAAGSCLQNKIPVLYRTQQPPGKIFPLSDGDWVNLFKQRRYLRKGEASVQPEPHHGLGLPVYLQMTSPIRRYSDLIIHRQLKAYLRKEELAYKEEDLEAIKAYSERWIEIADLVERESRRYWLFKYLERKIGSKFDAVVLEASLNDYLLLVPDFALEVSCARGMKSFSEGDWLQVVLELVKPRQGIIKVIPV